MNLDEIEGKRVVLGSQSVSRRRLLHRLVPKFDTLSADIDESALRTENPQDLPLMLAHAKAEALLPRLSGEVLLITSDQVVICDGELREKPITHEQARAWLESYHHAPAETHTAIVVQETVTGKRSEGIDVARVFFHPIPEEVIALLIEEGDIMRAAGGFLIEHPLLEPCVARIEGERESIMGMPLALTARLLAEALR